jgi:glycosyltransferase involved in cell wall biosynthesis
MTSIVFEDEELQVFWLNGSSDFLLIAFGDLVSLANGQSFSVQRPASKLGITCLGVMAKRPNWYPRRNLEKLALAVSSLIAPYKNRVAYGASMGGHGAIKAAKLFQATTTIALCPQWSINPDDQKTVPLGWSEHFDKQVMSDMALQRGDLSGSIVILSDPGELRDEFHRQQIAALSKNVISVSVYFCDHNITPVLSGTPNFEEVLTLCRKGQYQALARFIDKVRRPHFFRKKALVERGLARKANLTARVALRRLKYDAQMREVIRELPDALKDRLRKAVGPADKLNYALFSINEAPTTFDKFTRSLELEREFDFQFELVTPFGTKVFYDVRKASLVHCAEGQAPSYYRPVSLFLHNEKLELFVEGRFCRVSLPERRGRVALHDIFFTLQNQEGGRVALQRDGLFLSADPRGTVSCDRVQASDWEFFQVKVTASPDDRRSKMNVTHTGGAPMISSQLGGERSAVRAATTSSEAGTPGIVRHETSITICAIAKNESRYIVEWLAYHLAIGADHIVVYNNDSEDDQAAKLEAIARHDSRVTWQTWKSQPGISPQISAYNDALRKVTTRWICFIDIDEFLVPLEDQTIAEWLATIPDDVSSVHLNWRGFGSSGVQSPVYDLVTRTFMMAAPVGWGNHHHFKTIARANLSTEALIHNVLTSSGRRTLSDFSDFETINNGISNRIAYDRIQINHYQCKTFEEFSARMRRGDANVAEGPGKLRDGSEERFKQLDLNAEENSAIRRFDSRVDEELGRLNAMLKKNF